MKKYKPKMAWCPKCKKMMRVKSHKRVVAKNGRMMQKGKCVDCDTNTSLFIKKDEQ